MCTRKKPLYFPLFLKLFESFSLFTSRHRKIRQKEAFIFLFVQSPLLFHLFFFSKKNIFPIFFTFIAVVFVHFFLSSFCSSLFAVLPFFFSLFSPSLLFFSISVFLFLLFLQSHVSLSFFPSPFCVSSFGLTHFTSLFCS